MHPVDSWPDSARWSPLSSVRGTPIQRPYHVVDAVDQHMDVVTPGLAIEHLGADAPQSGSGDSCVKEREQLRVAKGTPACDRIQAPRLRAQEAKGENMDPDELHVVGPGQGI